MVMKINRNILTSALAVVVALSLMIGTLLYAQQYTSTHTSKSNSFQKADGTRPQGGPPSGDFKKPGN